MIPLVMIEFDSGSLLTLPLSIKHAS
jgi:hypothetical protein